MYLTVEFDDQETVLHFYRQQQGRSDYPNDNLFKQLAVGKTYNFRMGKVLLTIIKW